MRRQLLPALRMLLVLTVLTGLLYPLAMTGIGQTVFGDKADGSLITDASGKVVGSALIGQAFDGDEWFQPRPSAAGDGYDGTASSSSNLGPTNPELLDTVAERGTAYRTVNGLADGATCPGYAVNAAVSGPDPRVSARNAHLQAATVADARRLSVAEVDALIDEHTQGRSLGFLGEPGVNVLQLNLALDA